MEEGNADDDGVEISLQASQLQRLNTIASRCNIRLSELVSEIFETALSADFYEDALGGDQGGSRFSVARDQAIQNRIRESLHRERRAAEHKSRIATAEGLLEAIASDLLPEAAKVLESLGLEVSISGVFQSQTFSGTAHFHLVLETKCSKTGKLGRLRFIASPDSQTIGARALSHRGKRDMRE